ncbi:MAG: OadG family protein [Oscillospiraceae bacterium]|nr:OadG family protein [Oscillospiraceae bacterium]
MEYGPLFVTLMGIGTVFFGLICIIFLTMIMGAVMKSTAKKPAPAAASAAAAPAPAPKPQGMQPEIVAAITAALSEEIGIPSHGVNIVNIKKI